MIGISSVKESGGGGGGGGAPTDATYVTLTTNGTLTNERVLTAGTNTTITDGGAGSTVTVAVPLNGAISTVTSSNLTANRAVVSDASGKLAAATTTSIELSYVSGVTSSLQTQLGTKLDTLSTEVDAFLQKSGTTLDLDTQTANKVLAGPSSGGAAKPAFRVLVAADLPAATDASETAKGVIELATQAETDAGTDDARAITPLKLFAHAWPTVSITGGVTLTSSAFSKIHICTGTSADYTVVLPAVSGNAGRWIAFMMNNALTKLVTLDGNGSETINGALTRVMWANEWCVLYCDGTMWYKQAGLTIPMVGILQNGSAEGINAFSIKRPVSVPTVISNVGGITDSANSKINCRRAGKYLLYGSAGLVAGTIITRFFVGVYINGTFAPAGIEVGVYSATTLPYMPAVAPYTLSAGDYIELGIYHESGTSPLNTLVGSALKTNLALMEQPAW
jgi:hypothetical protein